MLDYSKCSCNRIPLECNHCNHSNHSTLEWVNWLLANICGGYGTNTCGNKRVEKHNNNTDRNDYDKPKKAD